VKYLFFLITIFTFSNCGLFIGPSEYVDPDFKKGIYHSIYKNDKILVIDLEEVTPPRSRYIGSAKVSESIFSEGYIHMMHETVKEAKMHKANVIQIMAVNPKGLNGLASIESKFYTCSLENLNSDVKIKLDLSADEKAIISKIEGIRLGKIQSFKIEGYEIEVIDMPKIYNEKTINYLKIEHDINGSIKGRQSDKIKYNHKIFQNDKSPIEGLPYFSNLYILQGEKDRTIVFKMSSSLQEDENLELVLLNMYMNSKLPSKIFAKSEIDSIYFLNRYIELGPRCHWEGVRNIQCPRLGQFEWDLFSNRKQAELYINHRIGIMAGKNGAEVVNRETVPVIFEGISTTAKKYKIKIKLPSLLLGGSNMLIAYYVVEEINGNYVGCVMSHYEDEADENSLPPLISEIMKLK